ncbi:MAG: hypothetical protein UX77_C0010G0023 [Parcubacteria group bacterium GW2011_GWA1_47_11]|uniref:Uncharacterized protein n=1 Tax=Candidatus Yanofskybacteria bacterium RIFCSPHIGHO2_01_FULL_48_25b TaxID=1802672 RepID=A0A1F8F167_9BACT|nr:MAG: hypothetical protein UX77_C0010G0023 [Parcubacteria group bacterium GW2011_GWA1_47_11]OGN06428.1 MAG: hypothetical protein A2669_01535 [Candidatus Yanofskybacteria bacterium RIFCSPHIGHO2_01_FULL_48_25b]
MSFRRPISILLIAILVLNLVSLALVPRPAQAAVKSTVASFGGCFAAGVLTQKISDAIENLNRKIKNMTEGILKKFLVGAVPVSDSATADLYAAWTDKETRKVIITRCAAWAIMTNMTNNINKVVRTAGRDGGATFVKNWVNFQTAAQYRGENIFRAELSTARLCDYLSSDVKKAFGVDPKKKTSLGGQNTRTGSLQPFSLAVNCTLPAGFSLEKYQRDFTGNGGWEAYSRLLEPQNNRWGLAALSQEEIIKQRALSVSADVNQVLTNSGLTGVSGSGKADSCKIMSPAGQCLVFKDIKTTGNYLAQNLGASIGAQFAWLTSAQTLNTIIADATEVMLNRLLDFASSDEGNYHAADDSGGTVEDTSGPGSPGDSESASCFNACVAGCGGTNIQSCITSCTNTCGSGGGSGGDDRTEDGGSDSGPVRQSN